MELDSKFFDKPPSFTLPTLETSAKFLQEQRLDDMARPTKTSKLWAIHVDLGICFWSSELPQPFWTSFRLGVGDTMVSLIRNLVASSCHVWQHFLLKWDKGDALIFHYLDFFCIVGLNCDEVRACSRLTKDRGAMLQLEGLVSCEP